MEEDSAKEDCISCFGSGQCYVCAGGGCIPCHGTGRCPQCQDIGDAGTLLAFLGF